jgi:hypothetical protein
MLAAACWLAALAGQRAGGAPVDASAATTAASQWLRENPAPLGEKLGRKVNGVETVADARGDVLYHVVHLLPSGFVIVSADDQAGPIVAFGAKSASRPSARNSLRALAGHDLAARLEQARAHPDAARFANARARWWRLAEGAKSPSAAQTAFATSVSTTWVAPFLTTLWDEQTIGGDGITACYNYYTPPYGNGNPNNYPCGCVATALAQLMYYFQYPAAAVGAASFPIIVNGVLSAAELRGGDGSGGAYLWSSMPAVPQNPTLAQCQAIGALTFDAGVAVNMDYEAGGSEATVAGARLALATTFLYANAILAGQDNPAYALAPSLVNMINPNLDARLPVILGIWAGPSEGHCAVCDGYGYIGSTLYHHLNLGWSGDDNAWYALPDIDTSDNLTFTNVSTCIYNVYPSGGGEIISGRIVDGSGNPVPGATVTAARSGGGAYSATSDTNGIYALIQLPSSSQFTLTASQSGYAGAGGSWQTGLSRNGAAATGNTWGANLVLIQSGAPAILVPPQSQTILAGGAASFSVRAAGGGTLAYQWFQNGAAVPSGGASLVISNVSAAAAGMYSVVVSNAYGLAASAGAALNVVRAGAAQWVQNGGFETGGFAGWTPSGNTANVLVSSGSNYAHSGHYGAQLGPSGALGFLTQSIPTTPQTTYLLSFWLDSPDGLAPNEFLTAWNGTNLFDQINLGNTGWTNLQFLVTASAAATALEFGFRDDRSYLGLDDINVNPIIPAARPLFTALPGNGSVILRLTNLAALSSVAVQSSPDLALWTPLFTNPAALGWISFTDSPAAFPARFYRATVQISP